MQQATTTSGQTTERVCTAEGFIDEDDNGDIPPETTDEELRDYNVNEVVFDDDVTVSDIDFGANDSEVWKSIDDEMSDDETVSEDGDCDSDAEESVFNDIRSQISDMESRQ